jgi:hypothetical protein
MHGRLGLFMETRGGGSDILLEGTGTALLLYKIATCNFRYVKYSRVLKVQVVYFQMPCIVVLPYLRPLKSMNNIIFIFR